MSPLFEETADYRGILFHRVELLKLKEEQFGNAVDLLNKPGFGLVAAHLQNELIDLQSDIDELKEELDYYDRLMEYLIREER